MDLNLPKEIILLTFPDATDSESDSSSLERKRTTDGYSKINRKPPQPHKRMRKKRVAIPVQPPKIPMGAFSGDPTALAQPQQPQGGSSMAALMYQKLKNEINSSIDKGKNYWSFPYQSTSVFFL